MFKDRVLVLSLLGACLCSSVGAVIVACTHQQVQREREPIYLPEKEGGAVQKLVEELSGIRVSGVTLPGLPPIVVKSATTCVVQHEQRHKDQQLVDGAHVWEAKYIGELVTCLRQHPPEKWRDVYFSCYERISYEKDAFAVQLQCESTK